MITATSHPATPFPDPHPPDPGPEPPPWDTTDAVQLRRVIELALRLGDAAAAQRGAETLLRYLPGALTPVALLGQALLEAGSAEAALACFRRVLQANPLDAVAWGGLAGALARLGQHGGAAAALRRSALHDPLGSEGLAPGVAEAPGAIGLGIVYLRRGHTELAAAELAVTLEQHPRRDDIRLHYAEALRRNGNQLAAREQLSLLSPVEGETFPALLLETALAPATQQIARCHAIDPDGQLTRRFFAPERPPWELPPAPSLPWDPGFEQLRRYLPLLQTPAPLMSHHAPLDGALPSVALETARRHSADPEIQHYIATTERLRHRLADAGAGARPLIPWAESRSGVQVLLSSRSALSRRFGRDGFAAVDERLLRLTEALRRRGVSAYCCYHDDVATLEFDGNLMAAPVINDPAAIRDLLRTISTALASGGRELGTLLLIGGEAIIPMHRLPNPIPDDDPLVLSDNPYASDDPGYLIPQRIVARIPEGDGNDPTFLLEQLDRMIACHQGDTPHRSSLRRAFQLPFGRNRKAASLPGASGYAAAIWRDSSRAVIDAFAEGAPLVCSPPLDADTLAEPALSGQLLYLNLHGASGLPNFYGQPDAWGGAATRLPVALRPDQLAFHTAGGIVVSEACYGAELTGRNPANSIALRALAEGSLAFVGSTVNAYGSSATPLVAADLLFQRMLRQLQRGLPVGAALHHARLEYAQEMYRRQGYLDDVDIKTLIEFVLLGDPWAGLTTAAEPHPTIATTRIAAIERMPKPRPKAVIAERDLPRDLVQQVRHALQRLLPGGRAAPLYITSQTSPRRQRKGDPEYEFVFSARESRSTDDGFVIAQTAHLTVRDAKVVKVAMTR
ncbi:MAG TPA: tetratricopeptide repeat protein [Roseiflexaceae bacterium]|nr:tetratricopeptide repeat protein [Roseiflexaceae bacterium]